MSTGWLAEERTSIATGRILDAAGRLFAERGVQATDMADIARVAGCSRATVYRYFENRRALHQAFVRREAVRVAREAAAATATTDDPSDRLVDAVLACLRAVRAEPALAVWFAPGDVGLAGDLAASTDVIDEMARAFLGAGPEDGGGSGDGLEGESEGGDAEGADADVADAARWLVRVIVSLLTLPAADEVTERSLLQRFVAPVVL